ncbi:bifunctional 2',3'-cyclic-nucleotide 2'-phosphodiesterase/3'-nucleotidase [Mesobacillus subterraneus]|uniref:bifunctional 2',3'-cyclic-nucleotide 2'-phosphodiesterase/3'-nucleotidase n=1 Tax=Mesobacillus subterraneus TaxID=285983 RepID=UPI00273D2ED2|nr:bifunctional 2',3'-cyclic-nucleotide 2'-phosphodiesterase/3'-nucleotidase [Mesobacillus subterraneus]WLR55512.1 bifunctional 2',3'-cyclic-nucleotide 2'-phosphodiesterase/3'-nucleotidase [Mesobacillus subterraneus]
MKKEFKKKLNGLAVSALTVGLLVSPVAGTPVFAEGTPTNVMSSEALVKMKIMGTTDVHGSIMNHDYFTDTEVTKGLVKVSSLVKAERKENANNLLLDNGDMLQGNPFTDYVAKVEPLTFVDRLAGLDRFETAIDISKEGWESAETVVLVRSDEFADALAAAPLAYKYNAPILLTKPNTLHEDTKAEIKRLGAKRVVIVGGTGAVSSQIQSTLSSKMKLWVKRLGGENRFETAALVAEELGNSTKAVLVNGRDYPDAISAAPYAAKNGLPILLTDAKKIPAETQEALKNVTDTVLIGGTGVISTDIEKSVKGATRFGGATRFETSLKVATELDSVKTRVFVSTGRGFADALAGSVLAAREDAPVVLVERNSMLKEVAALVDGKSVTVLGGEGVVSDTLVKNEEHPIYQAMNELDYDAATLGNHEFNYGLDFLEGSMRTAEFPFVSANVYNDDHDNDPSNDKTFVKPYQIIDKEVVDESGKKHTIKVGVIGFVAPQIMQWDKANLEGKVVTEDIVASAKKWVPKMKKDGAEIVVTLSHSGFDVDKDNKENSVFALSEVPGIDAIVFGHTHKAFPSDKSYNGIAGVDNVNGTINGVAAVQSIVDASHLGVIDLELEKVDGKWSVKGSKSEVLAAKDAEVDKNIVDVMKPSHDATVDYINQPIGTTTAPIYSYFARVQDDPSVQIVSNAQKEYIENVLKGTEYEDLPVLSSAAPFKAGRNGADEYTYFPAGEIAIKNVADLYKYPNTVTAIQLSGAQVKEYLEWTAVNFNQIDPAETTEQSLINSDFPVYNFDTLDGVTYEIDVTQPAKYDKDGKVVNEGASRIKNLSYEGKPVADDQQFVIATNNYRASFTKLANPDGKRVIYSSPDENRQVVMNYIIKNKTINPSADQNWSLAPINTNVNVTFESSPAAKAFAESSDNIKYVGNGANGFAKYQLDMMGKPFEVQLLGINDFHGQLDTFNSKLNAGGVEYLAAYLKKHEAENPENTLMLHAGDAVGASSPVSALLQDEPTIDILNKIGFDIGTVGNHEFDEGVDEMLRLINGGSHPKTVEKYGEFEGADFSYVAANVVDENTNLPILDPYVVKEVNGVPIGFIGIAYSDTPSIVTPSGTAGVKFTDETEAINKYAKELKDKGIEAIVVITHNPAKSDRDGSNATEELVDIAKNIDDEVDVLFVGHNHQYTNTVVDGKLLVQSYSYGTAFSDVDLMIDPATKDIVSATAEIVDVKRDGITPDAEIKEILDTYIADVAPILNEKIGTATEFISREANVDGESAMGNMVADAMRWKTGTDFAFMNSGGVRADIDAGEITWKEAFTVQPFGNDLVTMDVTGAQIKTLLEQQWGSKVRIMPVSGLKVTYDDSRAAGDRIVSITKQDGTPVAADQTYSITVNNYMADGGDGYAILATIKDRTIDVVDLEGFVGYIKANGTVNPKIEGRVTKINK